MWRGKEKETKNETKAKLEEKPILSNCSY